MRFAVVLVTSVLLISLPQLARACPPTCGAYDVIFLVVTSGHDRDAVVKAGGELAPKLGSTLVTEGADTRARFRACDKPPCLGLVSSDDESIGKTVWTPADVENGTWNQKTYAIAYIFDSYRTRDNRKGAERLLKKVKQTVPGAYVKPIPQCACE